MGTRGRPLPVSRCRDRLQLCVLSKAASQLSANSNQNIPCWLGVHLRGLPETYIYHPPLHLTYFNSLAFSIQNRNVYKWLTCLLRLYGRDGDDAKGSCCRMRDSITDGLDFPEIHTRLNFIPYRDAVPRYQFTPHDSLRRGLFTREK